MFSKAIELLLAAKKKGIEVTLNNDQLRLHVPKGHAVDQKLLNDIKAEKSRLIEHLLKERVDSGRVVGNIFRRKDSSVEVNLSFSQERLWLIDRVEGSVQYHIPQVLRLRGQLDVLVLEKAFNEVINRHEVLRTVIQERNGKVSQRVLEKDSWHLEKLRIPDNTDAIVDATVLELICKPFDLSTDHMLRATLATLTEREHLLVVTLHHIAADGWSMHIIVREFKIAYEAYSAGHVPKLDPLEIQYADYALWQRDNLNVVLGENLQYWTHKLSGVSPLNLPTDFARPAIQSTKGASHRFAFDAELVSELKELSSAFGATLYMTLLSCFKILLHHYSGQDDICVGTPIAGRTEHETQSLVGFFVNTLALRSTIDSKSAFREFLLEVKETTMQAYQHQDVPFDKVVGAVYKDRDLSKSPLFQVEFILQNTPKVETLILGDLEISDVPFEKVTSKFDLSFSVEEASDNLFVDIEYCTDLFEASTIRRMASHYDQVLRKVVKDPEITISNISLLSERERHQLLAEFNNTAFPVPENITLVNWFYDQVERSPNEIAVVYDLESLTYADLNTRSNRLSNYLTTCGMKPGELVPMCVYRSPEMIIGILAILKSGGAYVPIDPDYPTERVVFTIGDTSARFALCTRQTSHHFQTVPGLCTVDLEQQWQAVAVESAENPTVAVTPDDLAYVIYTSGSTGKPKGVMIEHRGIVNRLFWAQSYFKLRSDDVVLQKTTFCFDVSVWELLWPVLVGARMVFAKSGGHKDPAYLKRIINKERVTVIHFVPSMLEVFLADLDNGDCPTLQKILCSGEALKASHVKLCHEKLMSAQLHNLYGPTEASVDVSCWSDPGTKNVKIVPIGKPVFNTSLYVLNANHQPLPIGVWGELYIGGVQVARGYLNRDDLTSERFIKDPFRQGRMYRTGDICRWLPDGNIEYFGRSDNQIKIRGFRIELDEIDYAIDSLGSVSGSCVIAKPHQDSKQLVAYVVPDYTTIRSKEEALFKDRVESWRGLYDLEYEDGTNDIAFDISGWNDSFTGRPIPDSEMRLWVKDIVKTVLSGPAESILEIGCGTGLIYFGLAAHIKQYVGSDISARTIERLATYINNESYRFPATRLVAAAAHEDILALGESVDTILLNSVVQYFPGEAYLSNILRQCVQRLKGKGRIIVGDVRDQRLLSAFKGLVRLEKTDGTMPIRNFQWEIENSAWRENELCLSPDYFLDFKEQHPEIAHVSLQWKEGDYDNELIRYRYTAIMYVGDWAPSVTPEWQQWSDMRPEQVTTQLAEGRDVIAIENVPNPRLIKEMLFEEALCDNALTRSSEMMWYVNKRGDATVASILSSAEANGYGCRMFLHANKFRMNLVLERDISTGFVMMPASQEQRSKKPYYAFNIPLLSDITNGMRHDIRDGLKGKLPEYMIPMEIVPVASLPITNNGKADRAFLASLSILTESAEAFRAPETALEQALLSVWQELLAVTRIGVNDNFFDLGGDSIICIQVVSRLKRMGYELQPKDIFLYQTISRLSAFLVTQTRRKIKGEQGILSGESKLLPIQQWYFEKSFSRQSHFNQSIVVGVSKQIGEADLIAVIEILAKRHDSLRLTFSLNQDRWTQKYEEDIPKLNVSDLSSLTEWCSHFQDVCAEQQESLSLANKTSSFIYFKTPSTEQYDRLVVIAHHLVIDGVSWRIIFDDLQTIIDELAENKTSNEPTKGTSYRQWRNVLEMYAKRRRVVGQREYWQSVVNRYTPLPVDHHVETYSTVGDMKSVVVKLSTHYTESLLREAGAAYRTEINDLLLCALAITIARWAKTSYVSIGLEGHGREDGLFDDIDVSRTTGWFTSLFPVALQIDREAQLEKTIKSVKEQLHNVPDKGLAYGVLRHISGVELLQTGDPWDLIFNYLGQLESRVSGQSYVKSLTEGISNHIALENKISEKFMINSAVVGGTLTIEWSYDSKRYNEETIQRLSSSYLADLEKIITHCLQSKQVENLSYTPSDFGLGDEITCEELDCFLQSQERRAAFQSMSRLSSLQEGMLFHGLYDDSAGSYLEQLTFTVHGLDLNAFKTSWTNIAKHHSIFRTAFFFDKFKVPVQCVYEEVTVPVFLFDYSTRSEEERESDFRTLLEDDRRNGFDFTRPPLMRITIVKLDEATSRVVWTHHHMITDGWSTPIVFSELLEGYEAEVTGLESPHGSFDDRYDDYIKFVERRDKEAEEQHWKQYFAGIDSGSLLPFIRPDTERNKGIGEYAQTVLTFNKEESTVIHSLAQRHRLTVNTLIQSVWSYLLHRYTGNDVVTFGAIVSGRPESLSHVEERVGLYINTLPVKVSVNRANGLFDWMRSIQQDQIHNREYQHTPLADIQKWSGIGSDLFDTVLVFENYPVKEVLSSKEWRLQISDVEMIEKTNYPLCILASIKDQIRISFNYNQTLLSGQWAIRIRDHFRHITLQLSQSEVKRIGDLDVLAALERDQLVSLFNGNTQDFLNKEEFPNGGDLTAYFEMQVRRSPDSLALIEDDMTISYLQLNQRANQFAHFMISQGVGKGAIVPVYAQRSIDMAAAMLAILKTGAAYVPIDPDYPEERVAYLLNDVDAKYIVFNHEQPAFHYDINLRSFDVSDVSIYKDFSKDDVELLRSSADIACIIYTSGSSGKPKGVKLHHEAILNRFHWMWQSYPFENGERCASKTSIGFVDHLWELFGPLLQGVPSVIFHKDEILDMDRFIKKLGFYKVTRLVVVPSLLASIVQHVDGEANLLEHLRYWTSSGEVLSSALIDKFYSVFSPKSHILLNIYGSTEVTADVTCYDTGVAIRRRLLEDDLSLFERTIREEVEELIEEFQGRSQIIQPRSEYSPSDFIDVTLKQQFTPEQYIDFLKKQLLPGVVNVTNPGYMGHMTGIVPQFVKDLNSLMVALNQNLVKIETSWVASAIERQVIGMVHRQVYKRKTSFYEQHTQNPDSCLGILTSGGTLSNITAFSYALRKILGPTGDFKGLGEEGLIAALEHYGYKRVVVIGSRNVHYSVSKATQILGLGKSSFITFDLNDKDHGTAKKDLGKVIETLQKDKVLVLAIVGVAGTTETGRVESLAELGKIAIRYGIHYHVDGAFGGAYVFSTALATKLKGIELASSVTICGHKQMLLPMGASICLFKEPSFASYAENNTFYQARKGSHDIGRYTIEGSRSFIALLFHGTLRILGQEGLSAILEQNYEKAQRFARTIEEHPCFELVQQPDLNIIIYRFIPSAIRTGQWNGSQLEKETLINEVNRRLQKEQFLSGKSFVSYTEIQNQPQDKRKVVLRIVVMNPYTTDNVFRDLLDQQVEIGERLQENTSSEKVVPPLMVSNVTTAKSNGIIIGKPISNVKAYIVDKFMELCPIGVPGDLWIGGTQVSKGYHNLPSLTASRFKVNPFHKWQGLIYNTGDVARWLPDGNIEYLGRNDDQVKIRGNRVEPGEIENVLCESVYIKKAVVIANQLNTGNARLIAYVVTEEGYSKPEVLSYLKKKLPEWMIPSLVEVASFPLTGSGKIDKKTLAEYPGQDTDQNDIAAPTTGKEILLIRLWEDVLGVRNISVHDNFFDIGGNSLQVTRVVSGIRRSFKVNLPIRAFFLYPTITQLAAHLEKMNASVNVFSRPDSRPEAIPLSFSQERLWLIDQLEGSVQYHLPIVLRLSGNINMKLLDSSLVAITDRHESLRTVFINNGGVPCQRVLSKGNFVVTHLKNKLLLDDRSALEKHIHDTNAIPFNLSLDYPIKVQIISADSEECIVFIVLHHIASDGWSMPILVKELSEFYKAFAVGRTPDLQPLAVQYADFAIWQRSRLVGETLQHSLEYWREELRDVPRLNLPSDFPRPDSRSLEGRQYKFTIDTDLTEGAKAIARRENATLYMTLLTVCKILLYRYSGQRDICVGTPIAGRQYSEVENLIGYFVNTVAIRSHLRDVDTFEDCLRAVKEKCLMAFEHQQAPFEKVVEAVVKSRSIDGQPVFQVLFDLQRVATDVADSSPDDIAIANESVEITTAKFDLAFTMIETPTNIQVGIEYSAALFAESSIERMARHFEAVLRVVANKDSFPIAAIQLENDAPEPITVYLDDTDLFNMNIR